MTVTAPTAVREKQYLVAGEAGTPMTIVMLRDRIRSGMLQRDEKVAIAGTDLWKPACEYPALERYFALLDEAVARQMPAAPTAAQASWRVFAGIAYPFTSITSIVFIVLIASTRAIPLAAAVVSLATIGYLLAIIRQSSGGVIRPPEINDVGGAGEWILGTLRWIVVALAWAVLPVVIVALLTFSSAVSGRAMSILTPAIFLAVVLILPACMTVVAVSRSVSIAARPGQMMAFIRTLGSGYAIALFMAVVMALLVFGASIGILRATHRATLSGLVLSFGWAWLSFYVAHLLGWAVYRRRDFINI